MDEMNALRQGLMDTCPGMELRENEPMERHTTFRIGGPARLMALPKTREEAAAAVRVARAHGIVPFFLGNGSDLLVSDKGYPGFIIKAVGGLTDLTVEGNKIRAGSGVLLSTLSRAALEHGLTGLEFSNGIPGSLGGAITMNAGAYDGDMSMVVRSVDFVDGEGALKTLSGADLDFAYRHSAFSDGRRLILGAELELAPGKPDQIQALMDDLWNRRRHKQPLDKPSAGSTFKRPQGYFAAALIDECKLKGARVGGAEVSKKHAGFIINVGGATSADVLEGLRYAHPAVDLVLQFRALSKLKSTYCDGLLKVIGPDGRIHSNFNQTETRTGRISSTEPNLQNIPVRTELGREFRRFFCAREGWLLVDADYSQIELRVLAHVADDANMIEAFRTGADIHAETAAQVFHMPPDMVTPLMRSRAKAVNFGIVYGIGAFSLSKDINVTRKEAEQYIKDYLAHYAGVDRYMKQVVEQAKEQGYVETMFGRRRYLPELTSSNFNLRAFGERVARNMPIQGTAADIIKIAMIRVEERLRREGFKARLILQVHDELIVEAPQEEAQQVAVLLREEMEHAVTLKVPMTADAAIGKTWYDAKG